MASASKEKAKRMHDYVLSRLSNSGIYVVRDVAADQYLTRFRAQDYNVFLHTDSLNVQDLGARVSELIKARQAIVNIFYKETNPGENPVFFDVLDHERALDFSSMSRRSYSDARKCIELTAPEKRILDLQRANELCYYVPNNTPFGGHTSEGIVKYSFQNVGANYALPEKKVVLEGALVFSPVRKNSSFMHFVRNNHSLVEKKKLYKKLSETQRIDFLRQTGTSVEDWGQEGVDIYLNPQ